MGTGAACKRGMGCGLGSGDVVWDNARELLTN